MCPRTGEGTLGLTTGARLLGGHNQKGGTMAQQKTHYHRRNRALCWRAGGQYTTRPSAVTCWRCRRALGEVHGRVARAGG